MRVTLSRSAAVYLREETRYLRSKNPSAAAKFARLMLDARLNIQQFPDIGANASELPIPEARTWVAGDYLLDYRMRTDRVEIVTIRHGRMKPPISDGDLDDDGDDYDV